MNTIESSKMKVQKYFASANGGEGFRSYFDKVFDNESFERIYILKGGPGTGKSSIMRAVCASAKKHGAVCEEILCSSDPDSLDGIIVKGEGGCFGVIDGTAPHTRDAHTPGAVDEIIDLGRFWDADKLTEHKNEIIALQKKKRASYDNAYALLSSALVCLRRKNEILDDCIDKPKLKSAVERLLGTGRKTGSIPHIRYKIDRAISAKGAYSCESYSKLSDSICVFGHHGASYAVMNEIYRYALNRDMSVTVSPTPISPDLIDGILIDSLNISIYDSGKYKPDNARKGINSERFLIEEKVRDAKPAIRAMTKQYEGALAAAYAELAKSRQFHFDLEKIYTSAMNFRQIDIVKDMLSEKVKAFCT